MIPPYLLKVLAGGLSGALLLFVGLSWAIGTDPLRGLYNLIKPSPARVAANPTLTDATGYRVSWLGDLESRELAESSGLTDSQLHPGVLWSINDSGGDPELFALDQAGRHIATVSLSDVSAFDWESLDSFVLEGVSYIAIGDIGDNLGWRREVRILVVPEPQQLRDTSTRPAWTVTFHYPDGARDSEAMTTDLSGERFLIVSKRDHPPRLYSVPMRPAGPVTATHLIDLNHLPHQTEVEHEEERDGGRYRHMPSGMDYNPTSDRLLLTTYKDAYLYTVSDLRTAPIRVPLPTTGQREAITWIDADRAIVSRERPDQTGDAELYEIVFNLLAAPEAPREGSLNEQSPVPPSPGEG